MNTGCKRTEVGDIPEDWDVKTIDQVAFVTSGKRLPLGSSLVDQPTPHPYIRVTDMRAGTVALSEIKFVPESVFPEIKRYRIYRADIFISVAGSLGIVGKIPAELDGANLTENADRITNITCSQDYLLYVLLSPLIQKTIDSLRTVGAQPKLALTRIRKFAIPLPPTEAEQRAIAAALSDVDALLGGLDRLIAKKHDLKQAAMQQLLTGQTRLPGFHGGWEVKRLGDVADVKTGPFGSSLHESDYVHDGTPIITVEHLGEFGVEYSNLPLVSDFDCRRLQGYSLAVGDIVFSRVGSVDRNALIRPAEAGWLFSGRLLRVRPEKQKVWAPFLSFQFHSEPFKALVRSVAVGQTMASLNTRILNGIDVALPPLREQIALAAVLSDMDTELSALETRRYKTCLLKQGMMQELLSGRTRLVPAKDTYA